MAYIGIRPAGISSASQVETDQLTVDNVKIDGNTISSTDTNGDITLDPDGTGDTIIASGNVGIGTSSPNSHLTTQTSSTSTSAFDFGVQVNNSFTSNDSISAIGFHNRADVNGTGVGGAIAFVGGGASGGSGNITFNIKDNTDISNVVDVADEKMRIDSSGKLTLNGNGVSYPAVASTFGRGSNDVGFTWTSPNIYGAVDNVVEAVIGTVSDYRLKANDENLTGSLQAIMALRPVSYNPVDFDGIVDENKEELGLIAHEVQAIRPSVVTGEKDAIGEDGNSRYQSVNYAGLVPDLIAALQEAIAKIEALETENSTQATQIADLITRVTALENA